MTDRTSEIDELKRKLESNFFDWQLPIVERIVKLELEKRDLERR